jgi:hypothetical protein
MSTSAPETTAAARTDSRTRRLQEAHDREQATRSAALDMVRRLRDRAAQLGRQVDANAREADRLAAESDVLTRLRHELEKLADDAAASLPAEPQQSSPGNG